MTLTQYGVYSKAQELISIEWRGTSGVGIRKLNSNNILNFLYQWTRVITVPLQKNGTLEAVYPSPPPEVLIFLMVLIILQS